MCPSVSIHEKLLPRILSVYNLMNSELGWRKDIGALWPMFLWNFNCLLEALQSDLNWYGDFQGEVPAYWTLLSKVNNLERYGWALGVSGGKQKLDLSWKSPSQSSESLEHNRCGIPGVTHSPGPQTGSVCFKTVNESEWWFRKLIRTKMLGKKCVGDLKSLSETWSWGTKHI